jgi:hypothetical protein
MVTKKRRVFTVMALLGHRNFVSSKCFCFSAVDNSLLASNDANQFKF